MNEILNANIFFIITSCSTVLLTLFIAMILFHILRISRSLSRIARTLENQVTALAEVSDHIRESIFIRLFDWISGGNSTTRRKM